MGWMTGESGLNSLGVKFFYFAKHPDQIGAHPRCFPIGTSIFFPGISGQGMKLITHAPLMLRLRMSGAIPLLPICLDVVHRDDFNYVCIRRQSGS
jgi:hypothetical protein